MELSTDPGYQHLLGRISQTYNEGRLRAYQSVNAHMTETYWKIGHDIVEYEQGGKAKADYGKALLASLSRDLTLRHGKGFSRSNLIRFRQFYLAFPNGATLSHHLRVNRHLEKMGFRPGRHRDEMADAVIEAPGRIEQWCNAPLHHCPGVAI